MENLIHRFEMKSKIKEMQSIIDIENIANAHKSYSYIEAKSYDGLDIATQQIELAHKYYVQGTSSREDERKAIIDAIQIYIWPCLFEFASCSYIFYCY